jgi:cytochrome c-type biogenesis protein CcmH
MAPAGAGGTVKVASVEEATAKLAERLNSKGGSEADWRLLAQSYDFMGRTSDAAQARAHAAGAVSAPAESTAGPTASAASMPALAPAPAPVSTAESRQLLALAEKHRIAHDYAQAQDDFRRLVGMHAMTADAWANYADTAASTSGGRLSGPPADYLQQALRLDPDHPKALWLQASLFYEQHRYGEALGTWQHLARLLPADSSDAKIIAANIAEARRLSAGAGAAEPPAATAPGPAAGTGTAAAARIDGIVDIDPALREKVSPGSTLFVFAKSTDAPGPPLAVLRISVDRWPVKFLLDDSLAMMPQRKLSDFKAVQVEARISRGGQPLAQPGDLQGSTGNVDPRGKTQVRVVIRDVIG